MSLDEDAQRGHEASALLESRAYNDSWTGAYAAIVNEWTNSEEKDTEFREVLFRRLQGLKQARMLMQNMVENGNRAERELEELRKQHGNES